MSYNLLIWQWADAYADKNRRRREHLTNKKVAADFLQSGQHPAVGPFDQEMFLKEIDRLFPVKQKPFLIERYGYGLVFNYSERVRFSIVPVIGRVAQKHGLNSTEV
jgi:hypothetical protein